MKREEIPAHVGELVNAIFLYKGKATEEVHGFIHEIDHKFIGIGQRHPNDPFPANRFNKYPITCLEICEVHGNYNPNLSSQFHTI